MHDQQLYGVFAIVVVIAVIVGVLSLFSNIYPWWYINKKGKEAGLDDFTISQWRWKALWIPWLALFQFKKYLKASITASATFGYSASLDNVTMALQ
jgi:hypothetical protein